MFKLLKRLVEEISLQKDMLVTKFVFWRERKKLGL